jgi:hypothetical protein
MSTFEARITWDDAGVCSFHCGPILLGLFPTPGPLDKVLEWGVYSVTFRSSIAPSVLLTRNRGRATEINIPLIGAPVPLYLISWNISTGLAYEVLAIRVGNYREAAPETRLPELAFTVPTKVGHATGERDPLVIFVF